MKKYLLFLLCATTAFAQYTSITVDKNGNVMNHKPSNFPTGMLEVNGTPIAPGGGGLGPVILSGVPTVGQAPIATGSTTATWQNTGTGTVTGGSGGSTGLTLTGTVTLTLGGTLNWSSLNLTGSSLANLATRNFTDLQFTSSNLTSLATRNYSDLQNLPTNLLPGNITIYHVDGTSTQYAAASSTDLARGIALTNAVTAHLTGEKLMVGPGTYQVAAPLTILSGVTFEGAGSGVTTIKLSDQGAGAFSSQISMINVGSNFALNGTTVKGFLFDCNVSGQSSASAIIGAVSLYGTNCRIENCIGIHFGTLLAAHENFVFAIGAVPGAGLGAPAYGNKILNCSVHTPAAITFASSQGVTAFIIYGGGSSGSSVYTPGSDAWENGPEIAGCNAHDITVGTGSGQPAYFHMGTFGGSVGGMYHNNLGYNLLSSHNDGSFTDCGGFYIDTGSAFSTQVVDNVFYNVEYGVSENAGTSSHYLHNDLKISRNYILTAGASNSGIALNYDVNNKSSGINISGNQIFTVSSQDAIKLTNCAGAFIESNTLDSGSADIIHDEGGNSNINQMRNHTAAGTLITTDFAPIVDVPTQDSITSNSSGLMLQNDSSAPGNNQVYGTNASGTLGWYSSSAGFDAVYVVGSNATTTNQTLTNVPDLTTATLSLNTLYQFEADMYCGTDTGTTGTQYGVNVSVSPSFIVASYQGPTTAGGGVQSMTTVGTNLNNTQTTTSFLTSASETGFVQITGIFKTGGSGSPVFSIQHLKTTSGTSTVFAGSLLKFRSIRSFISPGL